MLKQKQESWLQSLNTNSLQKMVAFPCTCKGLYKNHALANVSQLKKTNVFCNLAEFFQQEFQAVQVVAVYDISEQKNFIKRLCYKALKTNQHLIPGNMNNEY